MRGFNLVFALLAALLIVGDALGVDALWVGGQQGTWYEGSVWQDSETGQISTAYEMFGRHSGWAGRGLVEQSLDRIIIGEGAEIFFDGAMFGNFRLDLRPEQGSNPSGGELLIRDGARLTITTGLAGDVDGQGTEIDADGITVTGPGSVFQRTFTRSKFEARSGGPLVFGSWRSEEGQTIEVNILDYGRMSNAGQTWFGAFDDSEVINVRMTIGEGARFSNEGALSGGISLDDAAGEGNEGDLAFIYNFDDATVAPQKNDYTVNFTGHGATMSLGKQGPMVAVEVVPGCWEAEFKTYQELVDEGLFCRKTSPPRRAT